MKLGLFGGAFDPVHYGHLVLAECCREQWQLDAVWFIPAAEPPHKRGGILAPIAQRLEMLELAIAGHAGFAVCRLEAERAGPSYTVDTLDRIRLTHRADELFLILGSDALAELPRWRGCDRVLELATIIAGSRGHSGEQEIENARRILPAVRLVVADMPHVELCSRDLRNRAAAGHSIRYRTPRAVEKYLETHGCYRESTAGTAGTAG